MSCLTCLVLSCRIVPFKHSLRKAKGKVFSKWRQREKDRRSLLARTRLFVLFSLFVACLGADSYREWSPQPSSRGLVGALVVGLGSPWPPQVGVNGANNFTAMLTGLAPSLA